MSKLPDAVLEQVRGLDAEALAELGSHFLQMQNPTTPQVEHGTLQGGIFRNGPANVEKPADISGRTIELLKNQVASISRAGVSVATGYVGYDLKVPAATLVPFMTPMLNMTPREDGVGVPVHNWKAITDLFGGTGPQGVVGAVADGGTPSFLSRTVVPMSNNFQSIGFQDSLTFQAEWRGRQLEGDMRAMIASQVLFGLKLVEENWLINMSDKLWIPAPILMSAVNSGGTITNAVSTTMYFIITAVNANGETLGTQMQSIAIPGTTSSITLTIFTVPFATKYNVYAALASSTPANSAMYLQSATTQFGGATALNQPANPTIGSFNVTMTAPASTGTTAYSTIVTAGNTAQVAKDASANSLTWQGALALVQNNFAANSGTGTGGLKGQIITPAAATGYLALSDIQNLFLFMYQNARAVPRKLFVNPQDGITIANLVSQNGNVRVVVDASKAESQQGQLVANYQVGKILNQATQTMVDLVPLPFLAQGTIMAGSFDFPYPVAGFSQTPFRIITNREYYGVEYPPTQQNPTQWGWGAFVDETVTNEFLAGWGILQGIVYH
jgi:hypothetical protein